jgi:DNA primase
MASTIEQIKNKLGIVEVVGSYLKLEKAGNNLKARCPFHNEKTPSFFVSPGRDSYYCFGCGKKGDIFNFVQDFEGVDFLGSLKILADRAGVVIEKIDPKLIDENQKLFNLLEEATLFYERELWGNTEALSYLKERGLSENTIKSFRIGFAPNDWRLLLEYLRKKGYKDSQIEEVGLSKESKGKVYDRFRSRIMFPINDPSGRVIAFSGRIFGDDNESAKYLNSPETKLFRKSNNLYAYDKAKIDIRKNDFAILVEGNVDVLMTHQAGYRNSVAPLGTALTREQLEKISRLTNRLVIAFDSDGAGFKASARGAKIALSMGIDLKVASIPQGYDPASLILSDGDAWKKSIKDSKHIVEFYLSKLISSESDNRKLNLKIKEEILPFVAMIENKIDQAHFVKILSEKMDVPQNLVFDELKKVDLSELDLPNIENLYQQNNKESNREFLIRLISGVIFWKESLGEKLEDYKEKLQNLTKDKDILSRFEKDKEVLIFERESEDQVVEPDELLERLKIDYLEEERTLLRKELGKAGVNHDEVLKKHHEISKEIEELKEKLKKII